MMTRAFAPMLMRVAAVQSSSHSRSRRLLPAAKKNRIAFDNDCEPVLRLSARTRRCETHPRTDRPACRGIRHHLAKRRIGTLLECQFQIFPEVSSRISSEREKRAPGLWPHQPNPQPLQSYTGSEPSEL